MTEIIIRWTHWMIDQCLIMWNGIFGFVGLVNWKNPKLVFGCLLLIIVVISTKAKFFKVWKGGNMVNIIQRQIVIKF